MGANYPADAFCNDAADYIKVRPLILENTSMQIIQQPDKITIVYSETCRVCPVTYAAGVIFPSAWFEFICAGNPREHATGADAELPHVHTADF
jgi:hypothetical protein